MVQVFAAHFGKALMCVSQSFLNVFSVAAELRVRALLLYLRHNPRETFVWGKGRVVYVAFITSSRGPKSNDTRARRRRRRKAAAVFVSVLSTRGGKGPSSPDDAGQEGGRSSKRRRSQFVWGKTSPFF